MMITEVMTISPGSLRAVFSFGQSRQVRIELDIHLTGGQDVAESHWAEIARIIDANRYQLASPFWGRSRLAEAQIRK